MRVGHPMLVTPRASQACSGDHEEGDIVLRMADCITQYIACRRREEAKARQEQDRARQQEQDLAVQSVSRWEI
jgi:hypothetical protein